MRATCRESLLVDRSLALPRRRRREVDCREIKRNKNTTYHVFEYRSNFEKESLEKSLEIIYTGLCFFKNNILDIDLELKSNLKGYFDINRTRESLCLDFLFFFFYHISMYSKILGIGIERMEDFCRGLLFEGKKSVENFASHALYRTTSSFRRCVRRILLFRLF